MTPNLAQQYLHRARMFRYAAVELPGERNGETFWPTYALLTHATELALKAFFYYSVENGKPPGKQPSNHDLEGWYQKAVGYGLPDAPGVKDNIELLNQLHDGHYTRYPKDRSVPDVSVIIDSTVDYLINVCTESINPR
jgi:hypothetical protein